MTERQQLPDTTTAWTIYQSTSGGGDDYYCVNNSVQSGTRPDGVSADDITTERYGNNVYCRAPGVTPPEGKVPFEFTVERNGANSEETLVAACELNPVIDGTRPDNYQHEVWFQSDSNVIRCFGYGAEPPPPSLYAVGDPGHVKAHADLVASVNVELARFGLTDLLPIKNEGDEGHLDDHNAIREKLEGLANLAGRTFTHGLPPVRSLGDPSHTDDHNLLAWAVTEAAEWPAWNAATGGSVTTYSKADGTVWTQHKFTSSGSFTVTTGAFPFIIRLIGKGGNSGYADCPMHGGGRGGGGGGYDIQTTLDPGTYSVTVGTTGSSASRNAQGSSFETVGKSGGGGNGTRTWSNSDRTLGEAGTWGGTSNGTAGDGDQDGGSKNFRTLWDGQTGSWGRGANGRSHSDCGANTAPANGIVAVTYQSGTIAFRESTIAARDAAAQELHDAIEELVEADQAAS